MKASSRPGFLECGITQKATDGFRMAPQGMEAHHRPARPRPRRSRRSRFRWRNGSRTCSNRFLLMSSRERGEMSIDAINWAFKLELEPSEKLVLLALANRLNGETGRCDPSLSCLEKDTGLSRATVARTLIQLSDCGWIEREKRGTATTVYRLLTSGTMRVVSSCDESHHETTLVSPRD